MAASNGYGPHSDTTNGHAANTDHNVANFNLSSQRARTERAIYLSLADRVEVPPNRHNSVPSGEAFACRRTGFHQTGTLTFKSRSAVVSREGVNPVSEHIENRVTPQVSQTINGSPHVVSAPAKLDPQVVSVESAPQITSVTKDFDLDSLAKIAVERSFVPVDLGIETVLVGPPKRAVAIHPCVKQTWAIPGDFNRRTDTWLVAEEIATLPHNRSVVCPVVLVGCVEPLTEDAIWPFTRFG